MNETMQYLITPAAYGDLFTRVESILEQGRANALEICKESKVIETAMEDTNR